MHRLKNEIPPVARGYPLVGVVPELIRDPTGTLARIASLHPGAVIAVPLGPTRIYLVTHPDHVESVLNDQWRNFGKSGGIWKPLREFFGYGLVTSEGELWIRHRRILQPLFSQKTIMTMADTMIAKIERYLDGDLRRLSEAGRTVNFAHQMNLLTESVLLETLFGASVDRRESDTLAHALNSALRVLNLRALFYFVPEFVPFPGQRAFRHATLTIDDILLRLFEARRRDPGTQRKDLLSLLMGAKDESTGQGISLREVRDELVTLFITGQESIAITVTWALHLLHHHPEIETRMRDEVAQVIGTRLPRIEDLARLTYGKQVIQEAMRLYPPSWFIPRYNKTDGVIGNYFIPKNSTVVISQYVLHHSPELWDSPERFDPDRFSPERSAGRHPYAYMPFGGGPRFCIGSLFAMMEIQFILAMMMQRFEARLAPGHEVAPRAAAGTYRPRGGMPMILKPLS